MDDIKILQEHGELSEYWVCFKYILSHRLPVVACTAIRESAVLENNPNLAQIQSFSTTNVYILFLFKIATHEDAKMIWPS
jgi:hypothetical protein